MVVKGASLCPYSNMYGLLFESIQYAVQRDFGEEVWFRALEDAGVKNHVFTSHHVYPATLMTKLGESLSKYIPFKEQKDMLHYFGTVFVEFCDHYGYHDVLRVSGRHYRDFLNGIDNLHEIMRFSYPRMRTPSFYVTNEDEHGCTLHYRSKRLGFEHYVIGQLKVCAKRFYNVDVEIRITSNKILDNNSGCHVQFRLDYNNEAFKEHQETKEQQSWGNRAQKYRTMSSETFFSIFPFSVVFDSSLRITHAGQHLERLLHGRLNGSLLTDWFKMRRPLMNFTWQNIFNHQKVVFELEHEIFDRKKSGSGTRDELHSQLVSRDSFIGASDKQMKSLLLRGQMKYIEDCNSVIFLCTPLLGYLEDLKSLDLYINDLSMHDGSRDMVLAGWQHSSRLEHSIEKQEQESHQIEENLKKLDEWKQKGDSMLYSMIPQTIAIRLKNGEDAVKTCQFFEEVTIMFSYVDHFSEIVASVSAMQVVKTINDIFTLFDHISDRYKVFKVETLGDAVYMVAGGVPDKTPDHAKNVAGLALELVHQISVLSNPTNPLIKLQLRTGMHTGSVVGGVVGKRMPQYCLFGDTVNTASRMETNSLSGRIHISEPCQRLLKEEFGTTFRGTIEIKGKGEMNTYWLLGPKKESSPSRSLADDEIALLTKRQYSPPSPGYDLHSIHAVSTASRMEVLEDERTSLSSSSCNSDDEGIIMRSRHASGKESCRSSPHMGKITEQNTTTCGDESNNKWNNNSSSKLHLNGSSPNGDCLHDNRVSTDCGVIAEMSDTDYQLYLNGLVNPRKLSLTANEQRVEGL